MAATVYRLVFGLVTLTAIGRQLWIQIGFGFSVVNFFSYFTNLSNLFGGVVLLYCAGNSGTSVEAVAKQQFQDRLFQDQLRTFSVVNLTVVGVVFAILLRDVELGALLPWVNVVLHYVMPLAVLLEWFVWPPNSEPGLRQMLLCLIFPAVYLGYVLIRGAYVGWYPYPFLDAGKVGDYGQVALYSAGIAVAFAGAAGALLLGSHCLRRHALFA